MRALQEVFALMQLSGRRYIDPSPVLKHLRDPEGNPVKIGDQEDVMQFNDVFLQYVDRGLQLPAHGDSPMGPSLVERLFYGTKEDTFRDPEGPTVHHRATDRFSQVTLQVSKELAALEDSLDFDTTDADVDGYTTAAGDKINVRKCAWFKELPPYLIFQLRRVDFDRRTQQLRKILLPFTFPETLYMDRYCAHNAPITTIRREAVAKLKDNRGAQEARLAGFLNFDRSSVPLDTILASTVKFLDQQQPAGLAPFRCRTPPRMPPGLDPDKLGDVLHDYRMEVVAKTRDLKRTIAALTDKIGAAYADLTAMKYSLTSVLVHSGSHATSGHYWAFVPCDVFGCPPAAAPAPAPGEDTAAPMDVDDLPAAHTASPTAGDKAPEAPRTLDWLEFNDKTVTRVSAAKVWREGGGMRPDGNASAYCLVYSRADADEVDGATGGEAGEEGAATMTVPHPLWGPPGVAR